MNGAIAWLTISGAERDDLPSSRYHMTMPEMLY
jgi:hypothetical protein